MIKNYIFREIVYKFTERLKTLKMKLCNTLNTDVKDFFLLNLSFFGYVCGTVGVLSAAFIIAKGHNTYISAIKSLVNYTFPGGFCSFKNHIIFVPPPQVVQDVVVEIPLKPIRTFLKDPLTICLQEVVVEIPPEVRTFWTDPLTISLQIEGKNQLRSKPCGMTLNDKDSKAVFIASLDQLSQNLREICDPKLLKTVNFLENKKIRFKTPLQKSEMFVRSYLEASYSKLIKSPTYQRDYTDAQKAWFKTEYQTNVRSNAFRIHRDLDFADCLDSLRKKKTAAGHNSELLLRLNQTEEKFRRKAFKKDILLQASRLCKINSTIPELKEFLGQNPTPQIRHTIRQDLI